MNETKSWKDQFKPIVLSEDQEEWLVRHFKNTKNKEIAEHLGVTVRAVTRLARKRGLKKTKSFLKKCQDEGIAKANAYNRANNNFRPKGYVIPNREQTQFRKGEKPIDRLGAKREAERIEKMRKSRAATLKMEKARALFGLPRQTKLAVIRKPKSQVAMRYALRKKGYIIERGGTTAYYNENTNRSLVLENKPRTGFIFRQL